MNISASKNADKYVRLCAQMCKCADDYTKMKIVKNNKAVKERNLLKKQLYTDIDLCKDVYDLLLDNEDLYVRQAAATDCLSLNIHIDKSRQILQSICKHGNRMAAMGAERALLIWEGKLDPKDPF